MTAPGMDGDPAWFVGRQERTQDIADPRRIAGLAALLDHAAPPWIAGTMPPLGHWLCFPPLALQSQIGADGHPRRTSETLLPASDLPRRMWAGSRIRFLADVPLGSELERVSTLIAAEEKNGRSGRMLFVTLRHEIGTHGRTAIVEEQDIVYRAAATREPAPASVADEHAAASITRGITPDPVMLFRYSALTFNGHRIHYDADYVRDVEGYPGLVVHGPLLATLLLDLYLRDRPGTRLHGFDFRARAPSFVGEPVTLGMTPTREGADLAATGARGTIMSARSLGG